MEPPSFHLRLARSPILRYGLAIVSVGLTLGLALLTHSYGFRDVELPLLLFAIAVTTWYAGSGPAAVATLLSVFSFDYFFTEPRYSLTIAASDVPYFFLFICFALLIASYSAVRRRVERDLVEARDHLQVEVSERAKQASLLDLTHDTIFVRGMDDIVSFWNRGARELYGWTAEEAVGKRSHTLLKTTFPAPLPEIQAELLRLGRWDGELQNIKADGTEVVVSSRWSLQRDEAGNPVAILETNNDITERKRREDEIRLLNRELARRSLDLEAANKELEAFAYSVSHDLRAPLRHMAGFTELLQKRISSALDERSQRYMATLLESAKRMGSLIDDLLSFSRIGRAETQKSLISLDQILREALNEVRQDTVGRDISWKIGPLPDFYGDRSMFRLVLVNLLSNAVKFTRTRPKAEIEIGIARENGAELHHDQTVVFVRDNGVGFDMKYVNKLFGVFQRLHPTDSFEGTGIGLATVQRILHRHGGRVWAEGLVGQGATFYFSIPRTAG